MLVSSMSLSISDFDGKIFLVFVALFESFVFIFIFAIDSKLSTPYVTSTGSLSSFNTAAVIAYGLTK